MNSINGLKTCRKGLHQYPADKPTCPDCRKISVKNWRDANIERYRENVRRWKKANPDRVRESDRRRSKTGKRRAASRKYYWKNKASRLERARNWRKNNRTTCNIQAQRYKQSNPEKIKYWAKNSGKKWRQRNPDRVRAYSAKRRAVKNHATPPWADHAAINSIYTEALRLQKETGIPHHVDHIYPLNSPYMCGLHVPENLQILTGSENCSKSNRTWPGQLDCQR